MNDIKIVGLMNGSRKSHGFGEDSNRVVSPSGVAYALRARDYKEPVRVGVAVIAGLGEKKSNGGSQFYQQDRVYDGDGTATSLNSQLPGGGQMYGIKPQENVDTIYYPKGGCQIAIRKLTPKECFRLQAFPDEMFERAEFVNSDTQLYKQAGNSVTVSVVYQIAARLRKRQGE